MGIFADLRKALAPRRRPDAAEAYLAEATSFADLEMRHRELDRGRFRARKSL